MADESSVDGDSEKAVLLVARSHDSIFFDVDLNSNSLRRRKHRIYAAVAGFSLLVGLFVSIASVLHSRTHQSYTSPSCKVAITFRSRNLACEGMLMHTIGPAPSVRREWRQLSIEERKRYIQAVRCLTTRPSRLALNTSRYDDFTYVHVQLVYRIHQVALSLPWHRLFVALYEQSLRSECGYEDYVPYWDWTLDAADGTRSPLWDPVSGFGKQGPNGCVHGGPVESVLVNYTADGYAPHCLRRDLPSSTTFGEMHGSQYTPEIIHEILRTSPSYDEFRRRLENGPHKHLHDGTGGEMPTPPSPNDPVFFLHHAQVDRLWSLWQRQDLRKRWMEFEGKDNLGYGVTLQSTMDMLGLLDREVTVASVMSTVHKDFCYTYS